MTPTLPLMPMGIAAASASGAPTTLPPLPMIPPGPPPAAATPAGAMPPMPAGPMPAPGAMFPAPEAPSAPPYDVRIQADGSSVYVIPSPDGDPAGDIILGRNEPPKLPKALNPAA